MTPEIALTLSILVLAVILFITERLRVDLVALLVLVALALTGLITPTEAFSGFSNPAVITVWAVFILSAGLTRTGIAKAIGRKVLQIAGNGELGLIAVIMITSGAMSAFMNNVGVAAMMLPVVVDIARRTNLPPSKLLMPLAYGSMLGGLVTLIGSPPNLLASNALEENGFGAFQFFDFAPVGLVVFFTGVVYMLVIGRRLLPSRGFTSQLNDPGELFDLQERLFCLVLPADSSLSGKSLADCRIGSALSLNVIGIIRDEKTQLAPQPADLLEAGDKLLVSGRPGKFRELANGKHLTIETETKQKAILIVELLASKEVDLAEITLLSHSSFLGQTLNEIDFRVRFGAIVLAIMRVDSLIRTDIQDIALGADDKLLVQFSPDAIKKLEISKHFSIKETQEIEMYRLHERLHVLIIPHDSSLHGKTLIESRLGTGFGIGVMSIIRNGETNMMPGPNEILMSGDKLVVKGKTKDLSIIQGLQALQYEERADPKDLESDDAGLVEIVLSPHSSLDGKSLRQMHFREKYGLTVLAIWRAGKAYRHKLRNMPLRFGDALLLHGSRRKMQVLSNETDFIILTEESQQVTRSAKAPVALLIMAGVAISVGVGWLPISVAAVTGATVMVLSGSVSMDEAYRSIKWQAIFLISGMLPLGIAMQNTGAAAFMAQGVVNLMGSYGEMALLTGIFILATVASQFMPNPVVVVLIAPIALSAGGELSISPYTMMMLVALAASTTFLSPVGHPSNVLIMGPGGYRFKDFVRVGLPLTILIGIVVLLVLPYFWPLFP